tara:strand:- start:345 stop:638 length:294 start_codon:yes stop_codon:yes gene_type:complete
MSVYWVLDNEITNEYDYNRYRKEAPFYVQRHGGEFCVRGGAIDQIYGEWQPKRVVILKFPSKKAFESFINDPEYKPWKELREKSSITHNVILFEGSK